MAGPAPSSAMAGPASSPAGRPPAQDAGAAPAGGALARARAGDRGRVAVAGAPRCVLRVAAALAGSLRPARAGARQDPAHYHAAHVRRGDRDRPGAFRVRRVACMPAAGSECGWWRCSPSLGQWCWRRCCSTSTRMPRVAATSRARWPSGRRRCALTNSLLILPGICCYPLSGACVNRLSI